MVPVEERVVKAPVLAVVAPIFVALIPVAVVLKFPEANVTLFAPKFSEDEDIPDKDIAPEVPVRFRAPVVRVNPSEAVKVLENVFAPAKVCVPVVTTPPKIPLAGWRLRTCPVSVAPFAFGVAPIAVSVMSPVFVPELEPVKFEPLKPPVQLNAPVEFTIVHPVEAEPPPIRISPVDVPLRLSAPVAPPSMLMAFVPVDVTVPTPAKDNAVAVTPIVSIDETPVSAPPIVTLSPPLDVRENVPRPFPIAVLPVELVLRLSVGAMIAAVPNERVWVNPVSPVELIEPEVDVSESAPVVIVRPLLADRVPADVIVPVPVDEIFPDVVTASPAGLGDKVVPDLLQ